MLCDERTAFSLKLEVRMSEDQVIKCMKPFCADVVELYESEWLRRPNEDELKKIEAEYRKIGFSGCIGAVDCAGGFWERCAVGWHGLHTGKEGKPFLRMVNSASNELSALLTAFCSTSLGFPPARRAAGASFLNSLLIASWVGTPPFD